MHVSTAAVTRTDNQAIRQMSEFRLAVPPDFRFLPTVFSHGWCDLLPFSFDESTRMLGRLHKLRDGLIVHVTVTMYEKTDDLTVTVHEKADDLTVTTDTTITPEQQAEIGALVGRCLSFDHDLTPFYDLVRALPEYSWIERARAGRMLVSPTVWEDLAKTLLTTNTTWAMTKGMVSRLVTLGDEAADEAHCFPTPEQIAALDPEALNREVRAGYRSTYLHTLAVAVAEGRLDVEAWRDPSLSSAEVYKALKQIKGFGDYAAGALMRLLGRFDQLGLDSVCRTMYAKRFNDGNPASDREIAAYYERFGDWRGLAVWMDVMREWIIS